MSVCDTISANIAKGCDNIPVAGVKSTMRLINIDDILSVTRDVVNPLIVTGITLKTGKKAFSYTVYKRGHKPRFTRVDNDFGYSWNHEVPTSIQIWDNVTKAQVKALNGASVVAILENLQTTGDARVEIYGLEAGLGVADGAVRDLAANGGIFTYTLTSDPESLEPNMPASFAKFDDGDYDYVATQAALAVLDAPAV